jgi:hypothetical protein
MREGLAFIGSLLARGGQHALLEQLTEQGNQTLPLRQG